MPTAQSFMTTRAAGGIGKPAPAGRHSPAIAHIAATSQLGAHTCVSLLQVIDRQPQIADAEDAAPLPQLRGAIELSDVHFSYPARPDVQIFSGMNLSIAAGQTVALVGESGSGERLRRSAASGLSSSCNCHIVTTSAFPVAGAVALTCCDVLV